MEEPLLATQEVLSEPVKCNFKRDHPFLNNEMLFTPDIVLRDAGKVTSPIWDLTRGGTGVKITPQLFAPKFHTST